MSRTVKAVQRLNYFLGCVVWFEYLTDYAWAHPVLKWTFTPIAAGIAAVSLIVAVLGEHPRTRAILASCLPSLTGGLLFILMLPIAWFFVVAAYKPQEQAVSPDGTKTAVFRGWNWIDVSVYGVASIRYRGLPLVERVVFAEDVFNPYSDYVAWLDEDTLRCGEVEIDTRGIVRPALEIMDVSWPTPVFVVGALLWTPYLVYSIARILRSRTGQVG